MKHWVPGITDGRRLSVTGVVLRIGISAKFERRGGEEKKFLPQHRTTISSHPSATTGKFIFHSLMAW